MNLNEFLEKYLPIIQTAKNDPASFYTNEENIYLNDLLFSELNNVKSCIREDDALDKFMVSMMSCFYLGNKLNFYKAREGMFKNGINFISKLDESWSLYNKIYKNEILETCNQMLGILDEFHGTFDGIDLDKIKKGIICSIYYELLPCFLFNGLEKDFLDYSAKGIALGSITCANFYISYLFEHDRHEEAQILFDKLFFKKRDKNIECDVRNFIVESESAFNFVFKGLLQTGKYEKARELVNKNEKFLSRKYIKKDNPDFYYAYSEINQQAWNQIGNYENNQSKIVLDEAPLHIYFSNNVISLMSMKIKQFIITSILVFDYLSSNPDTLDYSSAVMPIMRCIETLLYEIIGKSYLQFLKKELINGHITLNELPQDLVYFSKASRKNEFLSNPDWVTIGNALSWTSINVGKKNIPSDLFLDFCYEKMDKDFENVAESFVNGLRQIRPKRNKAAHTEIVTFEDARECNDYLLLVNKFIEFLLTKFAFCFEKGGN